jgi:hypothetical protein
MKSNMLVLILIAAAAIYSGQSSAGTLECASTKSQFVRCNLPNSHELDVRLIRQYSKSPCNRDYTWGADSDGIWVDKGCRAAFSYVDNHKSDTYSGYHPARPNDGNPFKSGSNEFEYYQDGYHAGMDDGHANMSRFCGRHSDMFDTRFEPAFCKGYDAGWEKVRY